MVKLRFLENRAAETYLTYLTNEKARMAIIIRLNMFESITHNYGTRKSCILCEDKNDTTEHAFECTRRCNKEVTVRDLQEGDKMEEIVDMFLDLEKQKRAHLIDEIVTNFNVLQREEWAENRQDFVTTGKAN